MEYGLNSLRIHESLIRRMKDVEKDIEYYNRKKMFYANEVEISECNMKIEYLKGKLEGLRIAKEIINV